MSRWTPEEVAAIEEGGNIKAEATWLATWKPSDFPVQAPSPFQTSYRERAACGPQIVITRRALQIPEAGDTNKIRKFITLKYKDKRWFAPGGAGVEPPRPQPISSILGEAPKIVVNPRGVTSRHTDTFSAAPNKAPPPPPRPVDLLGSPPLDAGGPPARSVPPAPPPGRPGSTRAMAAASGGTAAGDLSGILGALELGDPVAAVRPAGVAAARKGNNPFADADAEDDLSFGGFGEALVSSRGGASIAPAAPTQALGDDLLVGRGWGFDASPAPVAAQPTFPGASIGLGESAAQAPDASVSTEWQTFQGADDDFGVDFGGDSGGAPGGAMPGAANPFGSPETTGKKSNPFGESTPVKSDAGTTGGWSDPFAELMNDEGGAGGARGAEWAGQATGPRLVWVTGPPVLVLGVRQLLQP
jgi:hypothetical protein